MSNSLQKRGSSGIGEWWDDRPTWQKWGIGIGGTVLVVAAGGAVVYAIANYGMTISISTAAGDSITVAIGKAALERGVSA